jgi:hypothetical protein
MAQNRDEPERPRVEPEILPPDRGGGPHGRGPAWPPPPYGSSQTRSAHRFYVTRLSPLGLALLMLAVGLLAAVFLLILIGTALIWIPVLAVLVVIAAIFRFFGR